MRFNSGTHCLIVPSKLLPASTFASLEQKKGGKQTRIPSPAWGVRALSGNFFCFVCLLVCFLGLLFFLSLEDTQSPQPLKRHRST